jgi:hypothetical protein
MSETAQKERYKATKEMIDKIMPEGDFDISKVPAAPDYDQPSAWAVRPGTERKSGLVPSNRACEDRQSEAEVDCFFIHPTTYFGKDNWNQPLDSQRSNEWVDELVVPGQAGVFNGCARIFAPRYRQATYYSFLDQGENGRRALEFAYDDVARAFDHYMRHDNNGRPFFIASHSQGTTHAIRLLAEKIDDHTSFNQLIAAYLGGHRITMDKFGRTLHQIKPSERADDLGVVISWDTIYDGFEGVGIDTPAGLYYPDGWERTHGKERIATNPLTWKRGEELGTADLHKGAVRFKVKNIDMSVFYDPTPMGVDTQDIFIADGLEVSAQNKNQALCVKEVEGTGLKAFAGPNGSLHNSDFGLFYMNIRENAELRAQTFLKGRK